MEQKCDGKGSVRDCGHLLRIGYSLKYYQLLCKNNSNDPSSKQIFIEFCSNSYPQCLEDYIHLISKHSDNESLEKIRNYLYENRKLNICFNINECQSTKRHYIKRNRMDQKQN